MEKIFLIAIVITMIYTAINLAESKFLQKKMKVVRELIREGFFVFVASIIGLFAFFKLSGSLSDFFNMITDTKTETVKETEIFTGEPGF